MDECKGPIVCKNRIEYRTSVVISPENRKDVGCLDMWVLKLMLVYSRFILYTTNLVCHKMSHDRNMLQ